MADTKKKKAKLNKWIHVGDTVVVATGNDRGKTGKVLSRTRDRVLVEGINLRKKAVRPTQENQKGGIVEMERSIHASNVRAASEDGKAVRLGVRFGKKGEKEVVYRQGGKETVFRTVRKAK